MLETDRLLEGLLLEWEKFHSLNHKQPSKLNPTHQMKQQWSMVMIRDSLPPNDLSIFPPTNHENLHRQSQQHQQQQQQQQPSPKSTLSPPSDAVDVIPSTADSGIGEWLGFGVDFFHAKIVSLARYFGCKSGITGRAFRYFRWPIGVATVVLMCWLCKRSRRRSGGKESVDRLKMIIEEKDEKIRGLLNQIAEMNQVLVARHKALASKLTN